VWSSRRGSRRIEHIGSAHGEAELEALRAAAEQRIAAGQLELDLGLEAAGSSGPLPITASRTGHLLDALDHGYQVLGLDDAAGGDEVFRQLVLARIIEPASKLDSLRVLDEAGVAPPSYATVKRRLAVYAQEAWRQRLSAACAAHARLGPASLVLYDVSTLYFETGKADGFREPGFSKERRLEPQITIGVRHEALCVGGGARPPRPVCRRRWVEAEGSLVVRECCGRVASGPDKVGTCQHCQMVRVRRASREGIRKEPVCDSPLGSPGSKSGGYGPVLRCGRRSSDRRCPRPGGSRSPGQLVSRVCVRGGGRRG
jgi:hypothetical protein